MMPLPAPGVLAVAGKWAELVVGEGVVEVTVVGVVEHGFDALSEAGSRRQLGPHKTQNWVRRTATHISTGVTRKYQSVCALV